MSAGRRLGPAGRFAQAWISSKLTPLLICGALLIGAFAVWLHVLRTVPLSIAFPIAAAASVIEQILPGKIERIVKHAAKKEGVTYELEHYWRVPRTPFHPEVVGAIASNSARGTQLVWTTSPDWTTSPQWSPLSVVPARTTWWPV
mgnify:CR=1 FL=1